MELIQIEGDVYRVDRIEGIIVCPDEDEWVLTVQLLSGEYYDTEFSTQSEARAAQMKAISEWKKLL